MRIYTDKQWKDYKVQKRPTHIWLNKFSKSPNTKIRGYLEM